LPWRNLVALGKIAATQRRLRADTLVGQPGVRGMSDGSAADPVTPVHINPE
jgi:hypothetical protein